MLFCRHSIDISLSAVNRSLGTKWLYHWDFPNLLGDVIHWLKRKLVQVVVVLVPEQYTKVVYEMPLKSAKRMFE